MHEPESRWEAEAEPNALDPRSELPEFLRRLKTRFPRWYAFSFTGFVLGLWPGELRPLRRRGPNADLDFKRRKLLIRRSHTNGEHILDLTKTAEDREIKLPDELVEVLKEHVAEIEASPVGERTDLLFPSIYSAKILSTGCLTISWRAISREMGLKKRVTPKAMRRTFQAVVQESKARALTAAVVGWHKSRTLKELDSGLEDDVRERLAKWALGTRPGQEKS